MSRLTMSPFFHPTTVVLVDDNESFMRSLTLELPQSIAIRCFSNPEDALDFLNRPVAMAPLVDRCFTMDRSHDTDAVIHLDFGAIEQEINHLDRFRRISVALVDYAMPSLDGMQLCARMTDPYARRAMLTGVADEKQAVAAFNAGLIHRFIPKHRATAVEAVVAFIAELQQDYFGQYLARLQTALAIDPPGFLVDPVIAVRARRFMHDEKIVEYYLVNDPPGFLMLRSDGSVLRLVLLDQAARERQTEFVRRHGAPSEILTGIESGRLVGLFSGDDPDDYFGDESYPWDEKVLPGYRIDGRQPWLAAVLKDAATDVDFDPARSSYDAFLASLQGE